MGSRSLSKRSLLQAWLDETHPARITETGLAELKRRLAPVSDPHLRRLVRDAGVPLAPLVEGVRQDTLEELERTLLALQREYAAADRERARACRRLVIEAKTHARFAARKASEEKAALKQEMILWMLTWLENPAVFEEWVRMRKKLV